jgi:hypothetical protein
MGPTRCLHKALSDWRCSLARLGLPNKPVSRPPACRHIAYAFERALPHDSKTEECLRSPPSVMCKNCAFRLAALASCGREHGGAESWRLADSGFDHINIMKGASSKVLVMPSKGWY